MRNGMQTSIVVLAAALFLVAAAVMATPPPQDFPNGQIPSPLVNPEPPEWEDRSNHTLEADRVFQATEVRRIVTDLTSQAPVDEVELALYELLPQIYGAARRDLPIIGEAIASLRQQPSAAAALTNHYQQLPLDAFEKRLVVVGILGELRSDAALQTLHELTWSPLPAAESMPEGLTARDLEEMVQAKAVQGLAFRATPAADDAVRDVIVNHESLHVRVTAIDAYMWNHGDRREIADELYRLLPAEMHLYVERPRFHRGMKSEEFSQRLSEWREKWGREPEPTPARDAHLEGNVK